MLKTALKSRGIALGKLATDLGVTAPTISHWVFNNRVPAERVLAVEAATGISRHDLRPDLYPRESV
jgi:DNA-binding transcriptional regulator YdaS (Cro superfamily)